MSYGQIAALCGHPQAARTVGQIAHFGDPALPWHRVVSKSGGLAGAFTQGGREAHKRLLESEGIKVDDSYKIEISRLLWEPHE